MESHWLGHYKALSAKNLSPAGTLQRALESFEKDTIPPQAKTAVDLGCGTGIDTIFLLGNGWQVTAIDKEYEAIHHIELLQTSEDSKRLFNGIVCRFEDMILSPAVLINATFALPFCHPDAFAATWHKIETSLLPGGRFAGQFFGIRDSWANRQHMSFHIAKDIGNLLKNFTVEYFEESESDGKTLTGSSKHWHVFHVVAVKN